MLNKILEKINGISKRKQQTIIYGIIFLIGVALIVYAIFVLVKKENYLLYENDAYGISIKYPSDWLVREDIAGAVVGFVSPRDGELDMFQENLTIIIQEIKGKSVSLKEYSSLAVRQLTGVFKQMVVDDSKPTRLARHSAHRFIYHESGEKNKRPVKMMHIWFLKDGKAYQVTYASVVSKYNKYLGQINSMLKSLKVN